MVSLRNEPIAIIGSACRFPGGVNSPSSLWSLLREPYDVLMEIPKDRFDLQGYYHPEGAHHGTTNVRHSYTLRDDLRLFDAQFFNIKPIEADSMDPNQRLLMETVYESLESAGIPIEGLRGSDTAIYVGIVAVDYESLQLRDIDALPTYHATGIARSIISNRLSYFFDWHGPSMTIDTACSSSMIALHQAVQALRSGESRVAIAAGSELNFGPENYIAEAKLNLLSPTGRSRMWDAAADGYARGDGVAAVVIKTLSAALEDGDHIECIIRETGINQDGRTQGLTVPSSVAQTTLIRSTYAKAGLDPSSSKDRCQFFESHGTGTLVGDPAEAKAIWDAFFTEDDDQRNILHVGSIKTIIGHAEATAGLAGVLKGSLALQHKVILPNLLFQRLNPAIEPFSRELRVPTEVQPWPPVPDGCPRRVSVNSFGFGGTNGHAILESYGDPVSTVEEELEQNVALFTPFVFSATSERSLVALVGSYSQHLRSNLDVNPQDLAWTLQSRRSALPVRIAVAATSVQDLVSKIDNKLSQGETSIGIRSTTGPTSILGVFTGQGAQWAAMGGQLIRNSLYVRERLRLLEDSLTCLPVEDRPAWSLQHEMLANASFSRLSEAALSQPLCTALQIILVDLLRTAGITFSAVVGHSSGEIAAAYAAGYISAEDAVRIAYYRGFYAHLANGQGGQRGAMLAVGTSLDDARELCELPQFEKRLAVACNNSATSVTLSGDVDAILQAKDVFEDEKKSVRLLKVDTAYHSHHMLACSDSYVQALRNCNIQVTQPKDSACRWFSSVNGGRPMECSQELADIYWRDNMVKCVQFSEALSYASSDAGLVLEVGPHPALRGPATQTIADVRGSSLPYSGVLHRGTDDIVAFADALGFVWTHFDKSMVHFERFSKAMLEIKPPRLVQGLPSYPWDHERVHWSESRISRNIRSRSKPFHELLGTLGPDGTRQELRWRNVLRANEIAWLNGHQLQGKTVFPAAGYVCMALDASKHLTDETSRQVSLYEVHDLGIHKALTFDDNDNTGIETLVTLTAISPFSENGTRDAVFSCYCCTNMESGRLDLMASARITVTFGDASLNALSFNRPEALNMSQVDEERFYSSLVDLGYGYNGPFRNLSSLERKMNQSRGLISTYSYLEKHPSERMIVHPTILDAAFQAVLLGQSAPADNRLWALHAPTEIRCVRVNPDICSKLPNSAIKLPVDAVLNTNQSTSFSGDIEIYSPDALHTIVQIEGLTFVPFSPATAADDHRLFSKTHWDVASPNGLLVIGEDSASAEELELASLCERLSYYYMKKWKNEITSDEWQSSKWHHKRLRDALDYIFSMVASGEHPFVKKEWEDDSYGQIAQLVNNYPESIDLKLISAVGENMPSVVRGETTILEHVRQDNMLDELYEHGLGFHRYNTYLAKMTEQVAHRYPHMKILEIGAGTGGATKSILKHLRDAFSSYTYTDISPGFFEKASEIFKTYSHKMIFKTFDAEETPASQGFNEGSYDLVIASNVLHATKSLEQTLKNTRRLLKPGGYLLLFEVTNNGPIRMVTISGGHPGWWLGINDGRRYAPTVSPDTWNIHMRKTGFSGIETITPDRDVLVYPVSIIATQATDLQTNFLRRPFLSPTSDFRIKELVIIGGTSLHGSQIADGVTELLSGMCRKVTMIDSLPTEAHGLTPMGTFLNLVDLDEPIFKSLTREKFDGLKKLFELSRNVLWITKGCRTNEPYYMASIGFGRSISHEMPHLRLQFLDIPNIEQSTAHVIAQTLLRLYGTEAWEQENMHKELLWSMEPELVLEGGQLFIPRVVPDKDRNDRLNSARRTITKDLDPRTSNIKVTHENNSLVLRESSSSIPTILPVENHRVIAHMNYSTLFTLRVTPQTFLFIGIGTLKNTGRRVMCLSEENTSCLNVPSSWVVPSTIPLGEEIRFLCVLAGELLAKSFLDEIPTNSVLLVHEPDPFFAAALCRRAGDKRIRVIFTTISNDQHRDPTWIALHPKESGRVIRNFISNDISDFLDLSTEKISQSLGNRISQSLHPACRHHRRSAIFQSQSAVGPRDSDSISILLQDATMQLEANRYHMQGSMKPNLLPLRNITDEMECQYSMCVIEWTTDNITTTKVSPIDVENLFSSKKTYFLVGLTGGLGLSICEWMARNGARYICVASRNPQIDQQWLASLKATGTTIRVFKLDITDRRALWAVYDEICRTLPPVGGVANAAMVLQDTSFSGMTLEMMEKVLKPKIDGSNYLNELFNTDLDFFVLFSSLSSVVGNSGQSNYAAASAYMSTLVSQRRSRGLAASVFNIGRLVGVGYLERADQVVQDQLEKYGYMPISESDFHQMLAETIRVGRDNSSSNSEITTGLRPTQDDEEVRVPWLRNPRFSHFVIEARQEETKKESIKAAAPVTVQLQNATTKQEAYEILKVCFSMKLQVILLLSSDEIDERTPLSQLGVDSLVAVEVRSWFLKELKIDMPVLKVIAGGAVADLCLYALEKLPENILSGIIKNSSISIIPNPEDSMLRSSTVLQNDVLFVSETTSRATSSSKYNSTGLQTPPSSSSEPPDTLEIFSTNEVSAKIKTINWDDQTSIPEDVECLSDTTSIPALSPNPVKLEGEKVVVLTGATGFLAKQVLPRLVSDPRVSKIHCVAVRRKDIDRPRELGIKSGKVIVHEGDLSQPRLGLTEDDLRFLANTADIILHMGAVRSLWGDFNLLCPTNLESTKELIKMATPRKIPIHFVSSGGVLPSHAIMDSPASVAAHPPSMDDTNGYVASKWASERCLEKAAEKLGVLVTIHRFTSTVGESAPTLPVLEDFVRFANVLKLGPSFEGWKGHFDVMSAAKAADCLVDALVAQNLVTQATQFRHHACEIKMTTEEMIDYLEKHIGIKGYERLPGFEWVERIKSSGFGYFFASHDVKVERTGIDGKTYTLDLKR